MKSVILDKITQLENDNNIRILFACESGSRAWGFPSPDSDYDVRFVYAHPEDWYLSITEKQDVVELPVNEVLDINGWDLRKAIRLAAKSNAVIFEWIQSPVVYQQAPEFVARFNSIAPECFSPIAAMHHYLSQAKKKYEECVSDEQVKLKRYMYCLRAVLSGLWIANRKTIPPMELIYLLDEMPDAGLKAKVASLISLKATQAESYVHPHEILLEQFLADSIAVCDSAASSLPSRKPDHARLDEFFRKTIRTK